MTSKLKLKFLADMGISPLTVEWLRGQGYDARHLHKGGLERLPDPESLEKARREQRVLLTHDLDFPYLLAQAGAEGPSVVLFRLADMRPDSVNRHLELVLRRPKRSSGKGPSSPFGRARSESTPFP